MSVEARDLVGCCGLYCGLCTKFQSKAKSRCIGCKLGEQHSWCSIWNCCVKRHGFETCAECPEVPSCEIFLRRKVVEWIPAPDNLRQIAEMGAESWLEKQEGRQALVEELLEHYNEGRSMTFYCKACTRMPVSLVNEAIQESEERIMSEAVEESDMKSKAKIVKGTIKELAATRGVDLT
jgi:hypothetical protein